MKILWVCHFSNNAVRNKIKLSDSFFESITRKLLNKQKIKTDYAVWITNAIAECEQNEDIELHIISPHNGMRHRINKYCNNGVHYNFFKPDNDYFSEKIKRRLFKKEDTIFKGNRKIIQKLISEIKPDLIHFFGAENPYYSIAALDIDTNKYPLFISLQTLMSDNDFRTKTSIPEKHYIYRSELERKILEHIKYIGSSVNKYRELIWQNINSNAIFLNTTLAVAEEIKVTKTEKEFDYVYFAADISKAADVAIEAFAIACKKYPLLTLNIIGGDTPSFKKQLLTRINELEIKKNITFSGKLCSHDDVLKQIQKSKFALLPLKIDIISGTIREAMYSKIPIITTKTEGTPSLNETRQSILISDQGNYQAMAMNMIKLIESPELAEMLSKNGLITAMERWNNKKIMLQFEKAYKFIIEHHQTNIKVPNDIGAINPIFNIDE